MAFKSAFQTNTSQDMLQAVEGEGSDRDRAYEEEKEEAPCGLAHWPIDVNLVQVKDGYKPDYSHTESQSERD